MFLFAIDFAMMLYVQLLTKPKKCAMWFAAPWSKGDPESDKVAATQAKYSILFLQ